MPASNVFRVHDSILWPRLCPACGYSWQGLAQPRCPECGERLEDGEIVLVGESMINRSATITGESWKQRFGPGVGLILAAFMLLFLGERPAVILGTCIIASAFVLTMTGVLTYFRRRSGIPRGVLRLSAEGYRFGAKAPDGVLGHLRPWPKHMVFRWALVGENARIRAFQVAGRITLWSRFDLQVPLSDDQVKGVIERITAWNPGTRIIRKW